MRSNYITILIVLMTISFNCTAAQLVELRIQNHLFYPSVIKVKAQEKIKLIVINDDDTAEEFESYTLNREKIVTGKSKTVIFINALAPGEYTFFGEFYPKTAQGKIVAE